MGGIGAVEGGDAAAAALLAANVRNINCICSGVKEAISAANAAADTLGGSSTDGGNNEAAREVIEGGSETVGLWDGGGGTDGMGAGATAEVGCISGAADTGGGTNLPLFNTHMPIM